MHYTSGLAALSSFATAAPLPRHGLLWYLARFLLDSAGALFLVYSLLAVALLVYGARVRRQERALRVGAADSVGERE